MGRSALSRGSAGQRRSARRPASSEALVVLFDDDPVQFTVEEWRHRNLALYSELEARSLIDPKLVPAAAHRFLTEALIRDDNPAATDPQNAGHVRAQNENILHFGLSLGVSRFCLTVALEAGLIHDLNKSVGAPLRRDRFAVRNTQGAIHPAMRTVAESVGLNHLGEGTRAIIAAAAELDHGALPQEIARAIDAVIVHHGLGSSRFIRRLLEGDNEWWGDEFVDPRRGIRKLIHPPESALTLSSVIHDLADSAQQMEGGVAWLFKYPGGFWRGAGRSYWQMLSDPAPTPGASIPMSLKIQIDVETETCRRVIRDGQLEALIDEDDAAVLEGALAALVRRSAAWIDDEARSLARNGVTVYHDLARALDTTPARVLARLKDAGPESDDGKDLEALLWRSARRVDLRRVRDLVRLIDRATAERKAALNASRGERARRRGRGGSRLRPN